MVREPTPERVTRPKGSKEKAEAEKAEAEEGLTFETAHHFTLKNQWSLKNNMVCGVTLLPWLKVGRVCVCVCVCVCV